MDVAKVMELVRRTPLPLHSEKELQAELSKAFEAAGVKHAREVLLGEGDVVDFMLPGGLALEVKLREAKRAIHRQVARYCRHPQVKGLVLLTATATGFPPEVEGKPCWVASLGAAWL